MKKLIRLLKAIGIVMFSIVAGLLLVFAIGIGANYLSNHFNVDLMIPICVTILVVIIGGMVAEVYQSLK